MRPEIVLRHEFVEFIPDHLEEQTIYVSIRFATASHRCCCGCGNEVVTPLSPTDWELIFNGKSISLYPSIGNWGFECQSHYWITNNHVRWAPRMSSKEIAAGRAHDRFAGQRYFQPTRTAFDHRLTDASTADDVSQAPQSIWRSLRNWLRGT